MVSPPPHRSRTAILTSRQADKLRTQQQLEALQNQYVGTGHADKIQVQDMVRRLLPGAVIKRADAADALAIAICHASHRSTRNALARGYQTA